MKTCINIYQNDTPNCLEQEFEGSNFRDKRIRSRMLVVIRQLWKKLGSSIPFVYQDWAGAKAIYRLFSDPTVFKHDILKGHLESTKSLIPSIKGPMRLSTKTNVNWSERVNKK